MNYYRIWICLSILLLFIGCSPKIEKLRTEEQPVVQEKQKRTTLIEGSFFNGTNGIYFDSNDHLHIASVVSRLIGVVDTESGEITKTYTPSEGVEGPDDLTFGPDGSLYYTSILTGEVGRVALDGTTSKQFVAPGTNPITFSDDGRLFVALDFQGDGLYELDPELKEAPRLIFKDLGWLNGMDFGPDGHLYGPIWSKGQIVKIDIESETIEIIENDLITPAAVKFNSQGILHTIDHKTGTIYKYGKGLSEKIEIASGPEYVGADNLAFNSKDELYITNAQDGSLYEIKSDGSKRVVIAPSLCNAADIALVGDRLITPDILSMKSFTTDGEMDHTWHHMIGAEGIIGPFTIDVEGDLMALTSWFGNEVQIWNRQTNEAEATYHDYMVPINAILDNGALITAELGTVPGAAKVTRRIGDKVEVLLNGEKGNLVVPSGMACHEGSCFVADYYQGKVLQITENGLKLDYPKIILNAVMQPEGIQIGPNGRLIVAETGNNRILAFDMNTNIRTTLVDDIPMGLQGPAGLPPTWKLTDFQIDEEGNLYVTSDIENVVYKIEGKL